jgi:hypothetical protein
MHPLDTLARLDLARHDHDRDRSLQEATRRHALQDALSGLRVRGGRRQPRSPRG